MSFTIQDLNQRLLELRNELAQGHLYVQKVNGQIEEVTKMIGIAVNKEKIRREEVEKLNKLQSEGDNNGGEVDTESDQEAGGASQTTECSTRQENPCEEA